MHFRWIGWWSEPGCQNELGQISKLHPTLLKPRPLDQETVLSIHRYLKETNYWEIDFHSSKASDDVCSGLNQYSRYLASAPCMLWSDTTDTRFYSSTYSNRRFATFLIISKVLVRCVHCRFLVQEPQLDDTLHQAHLPSTGQQHLAHLPIWVRSSVILSPDCLSAQSSTFRVKTGRNLVIFSLILQSPLHITPWQTVKN